MHGIYRLKEMLMDELEAHGDAEYITADALPEIDTLAHALKNVCKIISCCESDTKTGNRYVRRLQTMGRYTVDEAEKESTEPAETMDKTRTVETLEHLMKTAGDERTRGKFRELIRDIRNA